MPSFEDVKKSESSDSQSEDRLAQDRIFDEFCADRESIAALGVTAEEFRELSRASLLGTLTSKDDLLFMLRQIRAAMNPSPPQSISDTNQMAETMRLAALAKLDELDLKADKWRRSVLGRVSMMLSLAQSFAVRLSHKVSRRLAGSRPS